MSTKMEMTVAPMQAMMMAIEVSSKTWLLGFSNGRNERLRPIDAWDQTAFAEEVRQARQKLGCVEDTPTMCCYEAGRDGFSIHRFLTSVGIVNTVIDPSSVEIDQRQKRRKTDRIDVRKMLRLQERRHYHGSHAYRTVTVPSEADEAAMRPHRERKWMLKERTAHCARVRSLLALHGVRCDKVSAIDAERVCDWAGRPLSAELRRELARHLERLRMVEQQIKELEKAQSRQMAAEASAADEKAGRLCMLRGVGMHTALLLTKEFFGWRHFAGRKQVASLAGLTGCPYASGNTARDQGISKAGNRRVRTAMIELAWLWLRWQPESDMSQWFLRRTEGGNSRTRRRYVVALARKLLVALWKYIEHGIVPDHAVWSDGAPAVETSRAA
jgi:transposase